MIKLEWKGFRRHWAYLKYVLPIIFIVISLKPAQLTWHLVQAGYFFQTDHSQMAHHMEAAIAIRPKSYVIFKKYNRTNADNALIKSLILQGNISLLHSSRANGEDMARFQRIYQHNAFLRYRLPHLLKARPWLENLDDVSLELLADKRVNGLSRAVFTPLLPDMSPSFMQNVADYCAWKGNTELSTYWATHARPKLVKGKPFIPAPPVTTNITASESMVRLHEILAEKYGYQPDATTMKENLLHAGSFDDPNEWNTRWTFSDVTDVNVLGSGSFTMGPQCLEGNGMLRLMGFFVKNTPPQKPARGGAWLNKRIPLTTAYYLFSFDYAAQTGKESVSFYLGDYIGERRLPAVKGQWKKAILIINGHSGKFERVQPLIRMWGKGTLLVDNVCFFLLADPGQTLPSKNTLLAEDALKPPTPVQK